MVLEGFIRAFGRCWTTWTEAWPWNDLSRPMGAVRKLEQQHLYGTVYLGQGTVQGDSDERMVLLRSITAYGRPREIGAEAWFVLGTVYHGHWAMYGDWVRRMVLKRSITVYGWCRETGRKAWAWNGLSGPRDVNRRLGQKHGLGMVHHGLWAL